MGLDTTHGCWSGAYSAFSRWRDAIAVAAGISPDWNSYSYENYQGEWNSPPSDPLLYLLVHSDCDGVIHPEHGTQVAGRLEQLLPQLDSHEGHGHIQPHLRGVTEQFIAGLREAAEAGEDVEFQ